MAINKRGMRGVVDPMALGFIISLIGCAAAMRLERQPLEGPPVAWVQRCATVDVEQDAEDPVLSCRESR